MQLAHVARMASKHNKPSLPKISPSSFSVGATLYLQFIIEMSL